MNRPLKIVLVSAASVLSVIGAVGVAGGIYAASAGGFEHAGYGGKHRGMHMVCSQGEDRQQDIVTFAEIRLSITDAQQPQWDAFTKAVTEGGKQMLTACDRMEALHGGNAPERLAEVEEIMEDALATTKSVRAAFNPLYEVLDDEQKATVERLTKHRHGRHHRDHDDDERDG